MRGDACEGASHEISRQRRPNHTRAPRAAPVR
jgi:hypothetical protein